VASVLAAGAFGQRSPGDEAVLTALRAGLSDWEMTATSHDPRTTEATHGCRAVQARNPVSVGRALSRSDAVVIAGGTVLEASRGDRARLRTAVALIAAARATGKPVAMVGVGAGSLPGRGARRLGGEAVRHADLTILRDDQSARRLADAGISGPFRVGADLAWAALGEPELEPAPHGDGAVAVALTDSLRDLAERLSLALDEVARSGIEVALQPWQAARGGRDDVRVAAEIAGRIDAPVRVLSRPVGIHMAAERVAGCGVVVALRRHALIAAAIAGTPALALAREPGLAALAKRLAQSTVPAGASPRELAAATLEARAQPPSTRAAIRGEMTSADESMRLLRVLLSRGELDEVGDLTGLPLKPTVAVSAPLHQGGGGRGI
jgi:polysaccharide pyruvyl transferase WcaK-like protein